MQAFGRQIFRPQGRPGEFGAGVFLGVFGERWVDNAITSVEGQLLAPLDVVVAVNGSSDGVLNRLLAWQETSRHVLTIAVNGSNLGPLGSWYANADLLSAPWVALMHQDDIYLDNHLSSLLEVAHRSPEDVLAVFGAMEGIDDAGHDVAAPPMDNLHLDMAPTTVTLPAILRRHPLPTPAVMLRNPPGFVDDLAWYDSGAPDSEWFARLACRGRFRVLDKTTMRYRLSSGSESRSTGWRSRAWQWAQSLDRLIHSHDFAMALESLPRQRQASFAQDLLSAIPARYPDSPVFDFLSFAAAQRMATIWQYEPGPATDLLASYLAADPGSAAARNLAGITGHLVDEPTSEAAHALAQLLGEPPTRGRLEESGRAAYRRFGHLLPERTRMSAYRLYDRLWAHRGAR